MKNQDNGVKSPTKRTQSYLQKGKGAKSSSPVLDGFGVTYCVTCVTLSEKKSE